MNLKNIAALFFRLYGVLLIMEGIVGGVGAIFSAPIGTSVQEVVASAIVGFLFIYFSKWLAKTFCKGLDDDVP